MQYFIKISKIFKGFLAKKIHNKRRNKEKGITTVLITHYMEEAVYADRVIVMNEGHILMDGTPKCIFSNVEELKAIGLDVPHPTELLYLLSKDGYALPNGVMTVKDAADEIEKLIIERRKKN